MAEYVGELGLRLDEREAFELFRGAKMAVMVRELEARLGATLPEGFVPELRQRMALRFEAELRPIEGAHDLLQSLRVPFCVASSGPREKIELTLTLTGLRPFFGDRIHSAYEVGTWKPDPGLFLHAARSMNVAPRDCAVVEDSPLGVQAGVAAGMTVFALGLDGALPDGVRRIRGLGELAGILRELDVASPS